VVVPDMPAELRALSADRTDFHGRNVSLTESKIT
jgi:hypothetical protein